MKLTLSILYLLFHVSINGHCQKKFDVKTTNDFYIDIKDDTYEGSQKIPFNKIIIRDFRYDTTKFGYVFAWDKTFGNFYNKIKLRNSNADKLTEILNKYYKNNLTASSQNSLVVFIKSLWLQKGAFDLTSDDKIKHKEYLESDNTGYCSADLEIFSLSGNDYNPLVKLKDDFFYMPYKASELKNFLLLPFDSLVKRIAGMNFQEITSTKKSYTKAHLDSVYFNRYELPIMKINEYKKGVYIDFESFKTNRVVYPNFIVKQSKFTDEVYILNGSGEELLTEYWGFCDGKDLYIRLGFNCFRLTKQNNTWDLYGNKYITRIHRYDNYGGVLIGSQKSKIEYQPLQLNMETGKVY